MIDRLNISKSAYFHRPRRPLTNAAINGLFRDLRSQTRAPAQNLFRHVRERLGAVRWSAIAFFHERDPGFLSPPPAMKERICGFVLLVEHESHVALFKAGLDLPSSFKTRYLQRVPTPRVEAAIAHADAVFEKIRLRNMSPSRLVLRSKTLEASDLRNAVGAAGASRFVPQSYSVRRPDGHHSATPSTGRIAQRSDKSDHIAMIDWAARVMDELAAPMGPVAPFIQTFARPIDLASAAAELDPVSFAVNAAGIAEALFDSGTTRLVRETDTGFEELEAPDAAALLDSLDRIFAVRWRKNAFEIVDRDDGSVVGRLSIGQNRITLAALDLDGMLGIGVESTAFEVGTDPGRRPLRRYIDREDQFIVLFRDIALAYLDGALYRDDLLADGGGGFLKHFRTDARLAGSTSEKGEFREGQTAFDDESVFGAVVDSIAAEEDILICDDLTDEWADFIGLRNRSNPMMISFYHAKHGGLSLGASPFHVSVSQAIKNLGRMSLPEEAMDRKIRGWLKPYALQRARTEIDRIVRGDRARLAEELGEVRAAPDVVRRVFIVTSSLSRARLKAALDAIKAGALPDPHFVQLYWLLLSFFSACYEVGAFGYVVCQE